MTATPPRLKHRIEAAAARLLLGGVAKADIDAASDFGARLARRVGPLSGAHRTAQDNLWHAFPNLSDASRAEILRQAWDNFGRTMSEYAVLPRLWPDAWKERVTVTGHERLVAHAATGKPSILFSGHLANWEMIPLALAQIAKPLLIVYRPPNNRLVDEMIGDVRRAYASALAPKGAAGARMILKGLAKDEQVFMVVDQKINAGLPIPFFGREAFTGTAVAQFAMKFACPVFPVRCVRLAGCRFEVRVEDPWTFEGAEDDMEAVRAALVRINTRVEEWIREYPGEWLWMHRRWPRAF